MVSRSAKALAAVLTTGHFSWACRGTEQELRRVLALLSSHPGHEDLFSCCQRKNFKGAPSSFFAIHVTAALVLFMTDGLTVSLPSEGAPKGALPGSPEPQSWGW